MALSAGSIGFVGYSSDKEDGLIFAVLQPVLAGSVITFTAENLDGTGSASWQWTAGQDIPAGKTVTIEGLAGDQPSSDFGDVEVKKPIDADVTGSVRTFNAYAGSSTNPLLLGSAYSNDFISPRLNVSLDTSVAGGSRIAAPSSDRTEYARMAAPPAAPALPAQDSPSDQPPADAAPGDAPIPGNEVATVEPVYGDGDDDVNNTEVHVGGIATGGGNDTLVNSGTIIATDGAAIDMGDGDDTVTLEEDSRIFGEIRLGAGNDVLNAADVNDDLVVDAGAGNDTVTSGAGDDLIKGGDGDDLLDGGEGDDALQGGAGNDRLIGGLGDDFLFGHAGNDILSGGEGSDLLDGGEGIDTADYSDDEDGVTVDLGTGVATGPSAGRDTLAGIENVTGGSGDDVLIGNAAVNILSGGEGDDRIVVGAGDTASGGAGDDTIEALAGGSAAISVNGGEGQDTVRLLGTGTGVLGAATATERLIVEAGSWSVAGSAVYNEITIANGGTVTSGLVIDNDDRVSIEAGGKLAVSTNAVTWAGGGNAILTNAGLIEASNQLLQTTANVAGTLVVDNLAGGTLRGALNPTQAGVADASITLNNAGLVEANGRVLDFRNFDNNGANATINNLAGGIIRQFGTNTDVIRPGQDGIVNNRGTITAGAGVVDGGDLIDFQSDTGGRVNNYAGGLLEGARHAVTGDHAVAVLNEGTIIGRNGSAVNIDNDATEADKVSITNRGTMQGRSAGLADSDGDAIDVDGLLFLNNYGTIEGLGASGLHDNEGNVSEGIAVGGGTIINNAAGKIYGYGRGIQVDNSGNQSALGAMLLVNDGLIQGDGHGPENVSPEEAAKFDLRGNEAINFVGNLNDEIINNSQGRIVGGVAMGGGNDRMNNSGLITATGGAAVDMGAGDDFVNLYVGATVVGKFLLGAGNDFLASTSMGDFDIEGGEGDDQIYIGEGDDRVLGGTGNDTIYAGAGNDFIDGGDGDDTLVGEAGNDTINGGAGADIIDGREGDDVLNGGDGDDIIKAGAGSDTIDGGQGYDTLDLSTATGPLFVDMAAGRISGGGIDIENFTSIENVLFGAGDNIVTGGNGDDSFDGGAGNDTLNGGAGDDIVSGNLGNDVVKGGSGDDLIDGGEGNDDLSAGSGDDIVFGGLGNDVLGGGSGDDRLVGGAGDDVITGGSGNDTFVFALGFGRDTIVDFAGSNTDTIEFASDIFADFGAAMAGAAQVGDDVVFTVGANSLTLADVDLSSLRDDDFRFV